LTDWPAGQGVYAYGVGFHQYLADRFGVESLAALAGATARRVPYLAAPAFTHVFKESLGDLWRDYEASLTPNAATPAPESAITTVDPPGLHRPRRAVRSFLVRRLPSRYRLPPRLTPTDFPSIYRLTAGIGEPRRVTTRYLGSTIGLGRDRIYFDQVELRRNTGLYSDLYAFSRADGRVQQLTSEARVLDPDLSPDGETLVCVQNRPDNAILFWSE